MADHGTRARYAAGCRCDPCRKASAAYHLERSRKQGIKPRSPKKVRDHGTRAKYVQEKCRCDRCKRANTEYQIVWQQMKRDGISMVDPWIEEALKGY